MTPLRLVALVAVGMVALGACGDSSPEPSAASASTPASSTAPASSVGPSTPATTVPPTTAAPDLGAALTGRTFLSTQVEGFTLVDGTQISLTFDGPNLSAAAGCNTLAGTWSVEGDVLVTSGPMASTMMACDPPTLMDQDTWLSSVLGSRPTLALADDTLTITAQGAVVTLVDEEAAAPDRALEGTTWTVDTLVTADAASSLPAGLRPPTLTFDGGTVAVDTGCNTGSGSYTVTADAVTFAPIATTRMACAAPAGQQVEQQVLAVLTGTAALSIDADVLTLTNGSSGLVAGAASDSPGTTAPSGAGGLVGPTWRLESATVDGAPIEAGERAPTLAFDGTDVAVDTGCNTGGGAYAADDATITFQPLISTLMACPEPAATMESTVTAVLTGTVSYAIGADGALEITSDATTLRYVAG